MTTNKAANESLAEYIHRLTVNKDILGLTWEQVSDLVYSNTGFNRSESYYRKRKVISEDPYKNECESDENDRPVNPETSSSTDTTRATIQEDIFTLKKERQKLRDEASQLRALTSLSARDESLREIALEVADRIRQNPKRFSLNRESIIDINSDMIATLAIGDWHYGLDVDLFYNKYNPEIAKQRLEELYNKVTDILLKHNITELNIINLGDLISGRIHTPLRINSRIDAVTQTMEAGELLYQFMNNLSVNFHINYCSVSDNHSRVDPNKKESLQLESFSRLIDWHLKTCFEKYGDGNVTFIDNKYSDDIATFKIYDFNVGAVHGDKDKQANIIKSLNSFTQEHLDLIISAHLHHFSAEEENETLFMCNGSLIGTDDFSNGLRLNSKPSQLLLISTPKELAKEIHKIDLSTI